MKVLKITLGRLHYRGAPPTQVLNPGAPMCCGECKGSHGRLGHPEWSQEEKRISVDESNQDEKKG